MIMCIDGDKSYLLPSGGKYCEWHGCRAALLYHGCAEYPCRYVVSGSDRSQCLAVARHFGLTWARDMWEGQYGPVDYIGRKEAAQAAKLLGGISTSGCRYWY